MNKWEDTDQASSLNFRPAYICLISKRTALSKIYWQWWGGNIPQLLVQSIGPLCVLDTFLDSSCGRSRSFCELDSILDSIINTSRSFCLLDSIHDSKVDLSWSFCYLDSIFDCKIDLSRSFCELNSITQSIEAWVLYIPTLD